MKTAGERFFVDSNLLLYTLDPKDAVKRERARAWLESLWRLPSGAVSWQVLHEFYWNATHKLGFAEAAARREVEGLLTWQPVDTSADLMHRAWHWIDSAYISYGDALIVAAAEVSGAGYLLTEDLQAGRAFGGVRVVDPFGEEGAELLQTLS